MSTMFGRKNDRRLFVIHIKKLLQPDTSKKQCKADEYSNIQHFPDTPVEGDRRRNLDESYANKLSLQPSSQPSTISRPYNVKQNGGGGA